MDFIHYVMVGGQQGHATQVKPISCSRKQNQIWMLARCLRLHAGSSSLGPQRSNLNEPSLWGWNAMGLSGGGELYLLTLNHGGACLVPAYPDISLQEK